MVVGEEVGLLVGISAGGVEVGVIGTVVEGVTVAVSAIATGV